MNKRLIIILYILGAGLSALAALGQSVPGYMDAEYYFAGGQGIAEGRGFNEPFLWNYLDDPAGLPHPSHLYWMPLASVVAAFGMKLFGSDSLWAARLPFILLSGLLPVLSANLSLFFLKDKRFTWLAGLLGVFSGVYIAYASIPETFVLYLVLGGLVWSVILAGEWGTISVKKWFLRAGLLGILVGLMHLTRADGIIWAAGGLFWMVWAAKASQPTQKLRVAIISLTLFIAGYLLVMGAWYARNLELFGTLMPAGNGRTLWITDYNQTFTFPATELTFSAWWSAGLGAHLIARWNALLLNLKNLVAVQGLVISLPLMIAGVWQRKQRRGIQFAGLMWLGTLTLMTLAFPFAGSRGGWLHSASAFQVLLWGAVPAGLERFVAWGQRYRGWQPERAMPVFAGLLVVISAVLTGWFYLDKVYGDGSPSRNWGYSYQLDKEVGQGLQAFDVPPQALVMVNNPPGFYLATGRSSIVIPGGGIEQTIAAADYYKVEILVLGPGQENLSDLYENPVDSDSLHYLGDLKNMRIFCFHCQ
ncbi:MAG: hypothetical protein A2X24_00785 [Chloroflexi bacterium GWB2_54_36]|nr:MAG: hypothetical protein A2X24_00785 [Chloroflexi bacterium GWB2_54_36]